MKIHFYKITTENSNDNVSSLLDRINESALSERERTINNKPVYLEFCRSRSDGSYELDFTLRRIQNGPGHSRRGIETRDFDLEEDAGFGEQTAAIWSPLGKLAVQYNHNGIRPGTIGDYLQRFLIGSNENEMPMLTLVPEVAANAFARLQNSEAHTRIECTIDTGNITQEMADIDASLRFALQSREDTGAGRISFTLSLGYNRGGMGLNRNSSMNMLRRLMANNNVKRLKAQVRNDVDGSLEILDLFEQRETREFPNKNLEKTPGLRYTRSSRINAIRTMFDQWLDP